jgi:hypothetical protein
MKQYAVIENSTVINLIVADSKELAENMTGKECVESDSPQIIVGSVLVDNILKPYASWILNSDNEWIPPKQYPTGLKDLRKFPLWNEEKNDFDLFDIPEIDLGSNP